jgi:hypothetical protein
MKRSEYQTPITESISFLNKEMILQTSPGSNEGTGNENWAPILSDSTDSPILSF